MRPLQPLLLIALATPILANIPEAVSVQDSVPAVCSAFGLTPQAAANESREKARRELAAQEAMRAALQLRSIAQGSLNPLMPPGAMPPSVTVSTAELVRASASAPGLVVTSAVISANEQLNTGKYDFYDPEGHLISESETAIETGPVIERTYVWFNDQPLAQINEQDGEIAYYFNDHLGTPIMQTSEQGSLIWHGEYEPFGTIFAIRAGDDRYQPLRLPGMIAHITGPEPDAFYNVHRYFRSSWARYMTPDPLNQPRLELESFAMLKPTASKDGMSLYAYAGNDPISYRDPLGLVRVANCGCKSFPASGNPGSGRGAGSQVSFVIPPDCTVYGAGNPVPGTRVEDIDFLNGEKYRGTASFPTYYIYDDCRGGFDVSLLPPFTGAGVRTGLTMEGFGGIGNAVSPGPIPGCCCR